MEFEMFIWLLASMGTAIIMYFWHRRKAEQTERIGAEEAFSNLTLYFDPVKGEGHLFLGGILVTIFASLFFYELANILIVLILE